MPTAAEQAAQAEADFQQVVLACDVGEAIDNPGGLVVPSVAEGVRRCVGRGAALIRVGDEWYVRFVDCVEDVLPPGHKITPDADVVVQIGEPLPPCLKNELEV